MRWKQRRVKSSQSLLKENIKQIAYADTEYTVVQGLRVSPNWQWYFRSVQMQKSLAGICFSMCRNTSLY